MAIARIITRSPEEVGALVEELHAAGYDVEVLAPDELRMTPAEVEIVAEKVSRGEAWKEARKLARRADADLFISPNVFTDDVALERGNVFLDAPRAALAKLRSWQTGRAERAAAAQAEKDERRRVHAEEAEQRRQEREVALAERRAADEKRREQEALEQERRRTEEAEAKRAREAMLLREREERARTAAQEKERRRLEQEERLRLAAEQKERIRQEQQRGAEERQRQLAELAQRHQELERSRAATTVIAVQQRPEIEAPAPEPVTSIVPVPEPAAEAEREDALLERFRRIAHEEVTREMAQRGTAAVPVPIEDDGGIRKWKGAFAGAACIAIALAIALGFAVSREPQPAQASPNGATVGPNGVTVGPQLAAPAAPVKPNPPVVKQSKPAAPAQQSKPRARHARRRSSDVDAVAEDTVVVHHYTPVKPQAGHVTTAKNGVKQISDDQ